MDSMWPADTTFGYWVSDRRWKPTYVLWVAGDLIATVKTNGSEGLAELRGRKYAIKRFRLPPYLALRDAEADELVARLCLSPPRGGFLAEFDDGQWFRLGWTSWWKREWAWTEQTGGAVMLSKHSRFGGRIDVQIEPYGAAQEKWPILAILELAAARLAQPLLEW